MELPAEKLLLDDKKRTELWRQLAATIAEHIDRVAELPVAPKIDLEEIRSRLSSFDFETARDPLAAFNFAAQNLREFQVHTPHPRYFGLFNPAPATMGIAAEALVAAFNPQLAAWSHSPFAVEVERHLINSFAARFGYDSDSADGTFCSGGAEANHTALLCALVHHIPGFDREGLRASTRPPVFYLSTEGHHSFIKAARFCGLGTDAVRQIPTDKEFRLDPEELERRIEQDRQTGFEPFLIVGTAGTTSAGTIDDIGALAEIGARENLWFHVDAAWGGAAALVAELRPLLNNIERADSITFDAHKWLSVPMGAGIFLTRHSDILNRTCRVTTDYMPQDANDFGVIDPFVHSMQWSRRFIGLKVFLSLAVAGWEGYAAAIRQQVAMGDLLRRELLREEWEIVNRTPLPVICFRIRQADQGDDDGYLSAIAHEVLSSGDSWVSTTRLDSNSQVLRACITNYRTQCHDVEALVSTLNQARRRRFQSSNV